MKPNKCKCGWHPKVISVTDYTKFGVIGYYVHCAYCRKAGRMMETPEAATLIWNEEEENKC